MSGQTSFEDFRKSVATDPMPPAELAPTVMALWQDARGHWELAHTLAQAAGGQDGAWVHAYLHRKEGDQMNAAYWYRRAGRPVATGDLPVEWEQIARTLLSRKE